jgi:hypothetical protein
MTPDQLVRKIRHHSANTVIGPSAARKMLRKGDIHHVRQFLDRLDLRRFSDTAKFSRTLDRYTTALAKLLPEDRWGARKFLNLYLRDATYNFYLRRAYRLDRVEHLLELPMDSFAATELHKLCERRELPRWKGVIHLTPEDNAAYQTFASKVATREAVHRVHLDVRYWRSNK